MVRLLEWYCTVSISRDSDGPYTISDHARKERCTEITIISDSDEHGEPWLLDSKLLGLLKDSGCAVTDVVLFHQSFRPQSFEKLCVDGTSPQAPVTF